MPSGGSIMPGGVGSDVALSTRAVEDGGNLSTITTLLIARIRQNNTYAPIEVAIGAGAVLSAALVVGRLYILTCDCSCAFIGQDVGVAAAATANSRKLWAGTYRLHFCSEAGVDDGISCITLVAATTGTLSIERIT